MSRDSSDSSTSDDGTAGTRDAGHEAVGQALLISIGLAGMLAATRLAAAAVGGLTTVMEALR